MKFFFFFSNIDEIKKVVALGMVDGVTTNPSLIAKENRPFEELLDEICQLVDGPVNGEVVSLDAEGMVEEGRKLAAFHANMVVKIPMTTEGLKAVKILSSEKIRTNVTLVFSCTQALMAAAFIPQIEAQAARKRASTEARVSSSDAARRRIRSPSRRSA